MNSTKVLDAVVIGAGPYGLSIAAHLKASGVRYRMFGRIMESWRERMPEGMILKSEGCASSLSEPTGRFALAHYCAKVLAPYKDWALPVSLDLFTRYSLWFQSQVAPTHDPRMIASCDKDGAIFHLQTDDGEPVSARRVIVATGITAAAHIPDELAGLPDVAVSHSSRHRRLGPFRGRQVIVVGAGQSALETAALLNEASADVQLVARRPLIAWNPEESAGQRTVLQRLRRPNSPLGRGLRSWLYVRAAPAFALLPERARIHEVETALGPAGAWWLKTRVVGRFPIRCGSTICGAETAGGRVKLRVEHGGVDETLSADHVIAATGYQITPGSFPFLAPRLLARLRWGRRGLALSRHFESSVAGLYFVGLSSAYQHGPVMRFVAGADQTARRLTKQVAV